MRDLNSVLLEGTVTKKAELRETVCAFSVANRYSEKEITTITIETIGKLAETCFVEACKGRKVRVVGRLKSSDSGIIILAEHIEFRPQSREQENLQFEEESTDDKSE